MSYNLLAVLILSLFLTSCATMIRGTNQDVSVHTIPPGANIDFSNGKSCMSPCTIVSSRKDPLNITIRKQGYQTHTVSMVPNLAGAGVIFGGIIDYGTGAVYDLQPNPLHVTLIPLPQEK